MSGLQSIAAAVANESDRPDGRVTDQMVGSVLADIARVLWPKNTAPNLAVVVKCEVRSAERYLSGDREWSGDAVAALVAEILRRHAVRNIKITKRE